MIAGEDCQMCVDAHVDVNPFSYRVAELDWSVMRLARNQWCAGWSVVILKLHASELFELGDSELCGFWRDVASAARALQAVYRPVKINYAVMGTLCPHIHCHLLPRFQTHDPHAPLNMNEREVVLDDTEYQRIIGDLRRELART
jgi:diadenosine tetraphosphate (Ap4A) HIT family hydrolase